MVNTSNSNGNAFQLPPRKKQRVEVHEVDTEGAEYICKANDVMRIKFLLNLGDLDDDYDSDDEENGNATQSFHPEFTHQFFGDRETIVGFKNLKLRLYYTPSGASSFFQMLYDDRLLAIGADPEKDTPETKLNELYGLPPMYTKDKLKFRQTLAQELRGTYTPPGVKVECFSNKFGTFEIYRSFPSESKEAKEQHERLETLALYSIDGASPVDLDDHRWRVYTIYQKLPDSKKMSDGDGEKPDDTSSSVRKFIAYLTAFEFTNPFRAARQKALRVCQILTLPHHQRQGHASALLDCVTKDVQAEDMFELTFEDPSAVLTRMRQVNDIIACKREGFFAFKDVQSISVNSEITKPEYLPFVWKLGQSYIDRVQKTLRITRKQIIFLYEVLKYEALLLQNGSDMSDKAALEYQREAKDKLEKLHKFDLDKIRNSEGVKNEEQYRMALNILYENQVAYFKNVISIANGRLTKG